MGPSVDGTNIDINRIGCVENRRVTGLQGYAIAGAAQPHCALQGEKDCFIEERQDYSQDRPQNVTDLDEGTAGSQATPVLHCICILVTTV
jgi:hypothetical protein